MNIESVLVKDFSELNSQLKSQKLKTFQVSFIIACLIPKVQLNIYSRKRAPGGQIHFGSQCIF